MSDRELKKTYGLFENPLNKKLIADLAAAGEDVLVFPSLKARKLDLPETGAAVFDDLGGFDWLILADVWAADYFIENLSERGVDFFVLDNLTTCALGEAVADRLRFVQLHADVIPPKLDDEAIYAAISNYAAGDLKDVKFLVAGEKNADSTLAVKLGGAGAIAENLPVYEAVPADEPAAVTKLKSLLRGGAVDEFIFSMPEDLLGLKHLISETDYLEPFRETRVSAVSEIVFQTLQEHGFRPLYFHYK
ncbi:MAG TPA: uroporphyrinogen-III synthase [Pyrinomonadaceae bacterium]|jgi:uroporphyrinogen-III synthase